MDPSAARKLWFAFAILVTYGSIYPGNFQVHAFDVAAVQAFLLETCCGTPHSGDVLGNFILFIPFGFLGMLAAQRAASNLQRLMHVCILGVLLAFVLQLVQIYLPSRNENLQDVAWNFLGIMAGLLLGVSVRNHFSRSTRIAHQLLLVPWILIGAWLAYRLIPFVPSIDFQGIKDSLKPLLLYPELIPESIFHGVVGWSLVAYFLRYGHRTLSFDAYLPLLILVTFFLEIIIVINTVSASNLVGAVLAVILWWAVLRRVVWREYMLAFLLFSMLVFVGLSPFTLHPEVIAFNWIPFHGFLSGSMYINAQAACEKSFFYGSLVYLLWKGGCGPLQGTFMATVGIALIEFAQTRFINHTPEITDPILVILAALTLSALKTNATPFQHETQLIKAYASNPQKRSDHDSGFVPSEPPRYVSKYIDLRSDQIDFLRELSKRMGISTSRAIRRIIDNVMQDFPQRQESTDMGAFGIKIEPPSDLASTRDKLISYKFRLRKNQVEFLSTFEKRSGTDFSSAARNVIDRFIANIET